MTWHAKAKGAYAEASSEAKDNALEIYGILAARGWTINAVCGLLGNMGHESGYNPWRWQSDRLGASTGSPWTNKGYGLVQFTPASKYINNARGISGYGPNFSDKTGLASDGYAQIIYVDENADYYATSTYPLSYAEFKASTENPAYLASAWLYNYERPADPAATEQARQTSANFWYQVLSGETPPPDPGPPPVIVGSSRRLPLWMYSTKRIV